MWFWDWIEDRIYDVQDLVENIVDGISDGVENVVDSVSDLKDNVEDFVTDVADSRGVELVKEVVSGKIITDAVESQVNEDISRLNTINDQNEKMVTEANNQIDEVKRNYEKSIEKLTKQKGEVFTHILKPYHEIMSQLIADSRFSSDKRSAELSKIEIGKISNIDYSRGEYNIHGMFHILTGTTPIAFAKGIITSVNIEYQIEKATEEQARLKAEKAKISAECDSINKVIEFLDSAYKVVDELKKEAERYIIEIKQLILWKGKNCKYFSNQDINLLKNSINVVVFLNQIVNTHFINEEGIINLVYKKYIQEQLDKEN